MLFACMVLAASGQIPLSAKNSAYRPDQILIQPKAETGSSDLAKFHAAHQAKVLHTFQRFHRLQVLKVPPGESVPDLISKYQKSGLVEFAEPDYLIHAEVTPNDPKYLDGTLWGLNNTGQNGGTPHADIHARDAWDVLHSASNVVVAVLDSGIRYTHQDLAANMWTNPIDGSYGLNAFTGSNNVSDDNGHGTLMAGVIGAVGNNSVGVVGVAWSVRMMACKCLDSTGSGSDSTLIACTDFACTNGAQIINASLSSSGSSLAVSNAIVAARDAGIIFVAAAGNTTPIGTNVDASPAYPACYGIDNIVSVAYTTRTDSLGQASNYGATNVALAAPGDQIYSTYYASDTSYYPQFSFQPDSGTSFSAAYVSGAFALMVAKYPAENYHQIINRVLVAVDPLPALAGKCSTGGRLNLHKALSPPINLTAVPGTNGSPFQLTVSTGPNRVCAIQSSPDLNNWSPVFTNTTDTNGVFNFVDNNSTNAPQLFYRAVSAP
jgi:subtilisin family serine protease